MSHFPDIDGSELLCMYLACILLSSRVCCTDHPVGYLVLPILFLTFFPEEIKGIDTYQNKAE